MNIAAARLIPPRIRPPAKPLTGLAFLAAFVRNPLEVAPQAVYEQDLVVSCRRRASRRCRGANPIRSRASRWSRGVACLCRCACASFATLRFPQSRKEVIQ